MAHIGRITLDLAPAAGNPRNSEGAFYTLEDKRIVFCYSRFIGGSSNDDGYACIAWRESSDGGETWTDDRILFRPEDHQAKNIMSVSFLTMQNGDIGLFYAVRKGWHDTRLHLRRSSDRGKTWSEALPCIPSLGYYVTNNDRLIRLANGRILLPSNLHRMRGPDTEDWSSFDGRGIPCVFYSDDDGHSWQEAINYAFVSLPHSKTGLQESGVLELKPGVIWQWMRTDMGCQYESYSHDSGLTWTMPVPSQFTSPCSPLSVKRIIDSDKLLAVWNPVPNYAGRSIGKLYGGRTPLVLASSSDEGKTWSEPVLIEDAPDHSYCYTAIHSIDDAVLLAYCDCAYQLAEASWQDRLAIRKISLGLLP